MAVQFPRVIPLKQSDRKSKEGAYSCYLQLYLRPYHKKFMQEFRLGVQSRCLVLLSDQADVCMKTHKMILNTVELMVVFFLFLLTTPDFFTPIFQ